MREILFRAKAINRTGYERSNYKNGDWVYGLITRLYDERFPELPAKMTDTNGISGIDVDCKTMGESTGLKDKHGKLIFEGDIVRIGDVNYPVIFNTLGGCAEFALTDDVPFGFDYVNVPMEVAGNIYDNPELLEDGNSAEQDEAKDVWYDNETEKMRELGAPSGWISCSDRKPEGENYKWAVGITSSGRCIAFQEHNAYENDTGGISVPTYLAHGSEITHWMPLPDVPKEVSE